MNLRAPDRRTAEQRRQTIVDLVTERQYVSIGEVQAATGVSLTTVHRDLEHLATTGHVVRIRGGATVLVPLAEEIHQLYQQLTRAGWRLQAGQLEPARQILAGAMSTCEHLLLRFEKPVRSETAVRQQRQAATQDA
jgi:DeoR/GlpR family transcriptional regulator of sugar metabolism